MKKSELEDLANECNAYMRIKHFMAKRIIELEGEIETIRGQLLYQSTRNSEILEWIKNYNTIAKPQSPFNFSGDFVESASINSSFDNSPDNFCIDENGKAETKNINNIKLNDNNSITGLQNQILQLTGQNENLKNELLCKDLKINKLSTDKILLFNELNELVKAITKVDTKQLDKYFKKNLKNSLSTVEIPTALGIKYSILSAQSQISLMLEDINRKNKKENIITSIFKKYQTEFEEMLDKNIKKKSILEDSDDSE